MLEMIKVPKRAQRLEGMLYKQLLAGRQEDMRSMAGLINSACLDVRLSRRLKKLLGIILKLGNQLNEVRRTIVGDSGLEGCLFVRGGRAGVRREEKRGGKGRGGEEDETNRGNTQFFSPGF